MLYRDLGATGLKVSEIGLGMEHLDRKPYEQVKETIDAALEYGVNIFDLFMPGQEVRENIAKAFGDRRKDVYIQGHIGSTVVKNQYNISRDLPTVKQYFEELLKLMGGYIDLGMMFFIDSETDYQKVFETEFIQYVQERKKLGDIRHIGFSSHNPRIAMKVIETGVPEMMLFSINPAFDMLPVSEDALIQLGGAMNSDLMHGIDPERAALYTLCAKRDIGITVMKTLGAGKLLSKKHTPFEKPLTVAQCVSYALSRPAVSSALLGCKTAKEVHSAMRYFTMPDEKRDYAAVLGAMRNDFKGRCVYCSHCQPCPVQIDIATVNKYLDIALLDEGNIPPSICSHYQSLPVQADACIACGRCESRCPFGVPIIDNMQKAAALLK